MSEDFFVRPALPVSGMVYLINYHVVLGLLLTVAEKRDTVVPLIWTSMSLSSAKASAPSDEDLSWDSSPGERWRQ